MAVKAGESSSAARKRQETETLPGQTWKVVAYAVSGLLVAAVCLAYWLGQTFGTFGEAIRKNAEAIERNAEGIERLERGLERLENLLYDIMRELKGDGE